MQTVNFKFRPGDKVFINTAGQVGTVVGNYISRLDSQIVFVEYTDKNSVIQGTWVYEDDLSDEPFYQAPPGHQVEFFHRFCPRCGLNLVGEPHQPKDDQSNAEQVEGVTDQALATRVPANTEARIDAHLERMVAPLTQTEKEHAERHEQAWLAWQDRQQSACGKQKDGQADNHQDLIPILKRKFAEWVFHVRRWF